jgi:hypothetical protein
MLDNNEQIYSIAELASAPRCTYVEVFTTNRNVFKGYISHAISERFLDIVNQGSILNQPCLTYDFLPLNDVEIYDADGEKEKENGVTDCVLNKNNILVVAEGRLACEELPPAKPFHYTLFRRKEPVWVKIQMQDFTITGQVHVRHGEEPMKVLEMNKIFLPVTTATISSTANSAHSEFDFIAFNKNQIISISKMAKP